MGSPILKSGTRKDKKAEFCARQKRSLSEVPNQEDVLWGSLINYYPVNYNSSDSGMRAVDRIGQI